MKILLLCSSRLALPVMQELAFFNLLAAVVVPRHCDEIHENIQFLLAGSGIPVIAVSNATYADEISQAVAQHGATAGLIISFSYKLPPSVYALPEKGFYNLHPGPLPEYRGADPVFWQIKNGEKQAAVTLHQVDEGWDTGPVVMREFIRLEATDTYGLLTTKLAEIAAKLTRVLVSLLRLGVAVPTQKQGAAKARYYKRQTAKDVAVDWEAMDGRTIVALINACNPWNKGATTKINNKIVRLLHAERAAANGATDNFLPGTVLTIGNDGVAVAAPGGERLLVRSVYVEEGFMDAARLRELGIAPGQRFEKI